MLGNFITPGQKVDLKAIKRVKGEDGEAKAKVYTTKIYDIVSDDTLEIVMPIEQTKLILLPVDAEYQVFFYTDNGLYESVVRITDRYKSNNTYLLLVELQKNLSKYQRRDFYRYNCSLELEARDLLPEEIEAFNNGHTLFAPPGLPINRGVIVDISGGGIRFLSEHEYDKGALISAKFDLDIKDGRKTYQLICEVLNVRELPNRAGQYEHRVRFVNIDNDEREEVIQYIFEEERKNRRKERGLR